MSDRPRAAVLTVGTELTTGLRSDTNGGEIARALGEAGYAVASLMSVPDELAAVEDAIRALTALHSLVVVTGGLGPTHDDITREAASQALSRPLLRDPSTEGLLEQGAFRHREPAARLHLLRQADVLEGARVLPAVSGTAPGQVVPTPAGELVLLPGPPAEMRPLLAKALEGRGVGIPAVRLRCIGITESDAQHRVAPAIGQYGVDLTLLAGTNDVEVVLFGTADPDLAAASAAAREALGDVVYSADGTCLPEVVLALARSAGARVACAESCTGGLIAAALTDIPGSSDVFAGGVVAYANEVKRDVLGVQEGLLAQYGAVSEQCARAMAEGALRVGEATIAVATTGIAGPGGGTHDKPVGLVWFGVARSDAPTTAVERRFGGDRDAVRRRATAFALDLLRRALLEM
jgi:nicotinamide-nucleotide amidase